MKYVIDTSVAFKWAIAETDSDKAILLRDDFRNGIHEFHAPDLFPTEIGNSLLTAERRSRIQPGDWPIFFKTSCSIARSSTMRLPICFDPTKSRRSSRPASTTAC